MIVLYLMLALITAVEVPAAVERYSGVHVSGAIHTMMMEGDISATIDLDSLARLPHLYALGAVELLKGEVQILDGKSFVSYARDGSVQIDTSFQRRAAMLVYAQVPSWDSIPLPEGISSSEQLEEILPMLAKKVSIDSQEPFPFLLTGAIDSVMWHLIDWPEGDTEHSHEKHKKSGLHGKFENQPVTILGFYSTKHQGVFTHHGTNMHLHVFSEDRKTAGHLDTLTLGSKMTLWLPRIRD